VNGEGTNQFGVFEIYGTAVGSKHKGNPTFNVELRKKYKASPNAAPAPAPGGGKSESKSKKKKKHKSAEPMKVLAHETKYLLALMMA